MGKDDAESVMRALAEAYPREELDLDAVRRLALAALAAGKQEAVGDVIALPGPGANLGARIVKGVPLGTRLFAHPPAGLPERQADCIMRCHDALIAGDSKEAYHWLYQLQDAIPGGDPYKPFEHIKSAAPTQEAKS